MNRKRAMALVLALFLFFGVSAQSAPTKRVEKVFKDSTSFLDGLEKKITALLLQKERKQALTAVEDFVLQNKSLSSAEKDRLQELKETILTFFFSQQAQDAYEIAASSFVSNIKLADKNTKLCLSLEPDNYFCRWAELLVLKRTNSVRFQSAVDDFSKSYSQLPVWGLLAVNQLLIQETSKEALLHYKPSPFLPHILKRAEFEQALTVKNYARAKEELARLQDQYPDYPDNFFFRAQLADLSSEGAVEDSSRLKDIYRKKCVSLSAELTRKYFYDINLCHRF